MIIYRLTCDKYGLLEGSCLSEKRYQYLPQKKREFFEPVDDTDMIYMIVFKEANYCMDLGIECMLFHCEKELSQFINKMYDNGIVD